MDGSRVHRRVDRPDPGDLDDGRPVVRSLDVSSEQLGVIAKIDVAEVDDQGSVAPVDYKRGTPPDNEHRAYDPERVQVALQALLLRDAGYTVDRGWLYFAGSRERVEVPLDDELVQLTLDAVAGARQAAASEQLPPPLIDSPKCPRCSLVGLCLPDETNLLAGRSSQPPRRLMPTDTNARPLYITDHRAKVGRSKGRITVKTDDETTSVRSIDVSQVAVFGNAQLSTQLVRSLLGEGIPVAWFSHGGWFAGMAMQPTVSHVQLRLRQAAAALASDASIPAAMIAAKIGNSRVLLRRNGRPRPDDTIEQLAGVVERVAACTSRASLLGLEGTAARLYFGAFPTMLRPTELPGDAFSFEGRNRRPPTDPVNCMLSYAYSLLVKDLTATLHTVGFDPSIGLLHQPRFGRPALALDLAEEFRSLIAESVVIRAVNNGEVKANDFIIRSTGVALTQRGRRAMLAAYERRLEQEVTHPMFGYRISYRRVLEVQARVLGAVLLGEIPEYVGFVTRWVGWLVVATSWPTTSATIVVCGKCTSWCSGSARCCSTRSAFVTLRTPRRSSSSRNSTRSWTTVAIASCSSTSGWQIDAAVSALSSTELERVCRP